MAVALTTGFTQTQSSPGLHVTINPGDAVVSGAVVRFPKGDVALAANTTTYVYLNFNSGAIETSTSGFLNGAWPICTAQTNTTDCVRVTDLRPDAFGGGGTSADTISSVSINTVLGSAGVLVLATGGAGGITITLPAATAGGVVKVKKVDSAVGTVTISGGTIDGINNYILQNQYQYAVLEADGSLWNVVGNN